MNSVPNHSEDIVLRISTGSMVRAVLVILAIGLIYILRDIILLILTSVVLASAVEPATRRLGKFGLSRVWAVLLIFVTVSVFVGAVFYIFVPPLFTELTDLSSALSDRVGNLKVVNNAVDPLASITGGLAEGLSLKDIVTGIQGGLADATTGVFKTASSLFGGLLSFILIVVISFYLAVQEDGVQDFLRVVTPDRYEKYVLDLWRRSRGKIGKWFQGQLVLGLTVGVLVFLGLMILQIPFALSLAILAAVFELIPFFGPILSAVPAVILGFSIGPGVGLMAIGFFVIIHQFENHLIYPLIVKKIIGVPPLIVILSMIVGAKLIGFIGILLSVPIAAIVMELVADVQKRKNQGAVEMA